MKKVMALLLLTALATAVMVRLAYRIRGYWAVGGEWLGWAALGLYGLVKTGERQARKRKENAPAGLDSEQGAKEKSTTTE